MYTSKTQWNLQKLFLLLKIIPVQLFVGISGNYDKNTLRSGVNMSKNVPRISDPTKRHDTELNLFEINGKLA